MRLLIVGLLTLFVFPLLAQQSTLDLEYRISPLFSRGYRQPLYADDKGELSVLQRTRLIFDHLTKDSLRFHVQLQDRRAWGETSEREDAPEVAILRAWFEQPLGKNMSVKVGRQMLKYDDEFLYGELNWGGTMTHDAVILKQEKPDFKWHLVLAYNANRIFTPQQEFYQQNFYKDLQFLWIHKDFGKLKSSFHIGNRGTQRSDLIIRHRQTVGTLTTYQLNDRVSFRGVYYHQLGADTLNQRVNAFMWSARARAQVTDGLSLALGIKEASGTNVSESGNENNTFDVLSGALHRHYGYLDYFYVFVDPVFGVRDYYVTVDYQKKGIKVENDLHLFQTSNTAYSTADVLFLDPLSEKLGIEYDFRLTANLTENIWGHLGYSVMWASGTLDEMFGQTDRKDSQFLYLVITASPRLFESKNSSYGYFNPSY